MTKDKSHFLGGGTIWDWHQTEGLVLSRKVKLHIFNNNVSKRLSFQIIEGMLSGPKALLLSSCLITVSSSVRNIYV